MKDFQCKDCLWCQTTFLMLKYQEEHTFCHIRSFSCGKTSVSLKSVNANPEIPFVQLNLFDL